MFEAIVSQAQFAICLRENCRGIDQCSSSAALGSEHTEMFVNHVTVFSQSVSHIRLSHTIYGDVLPKGVAYHGIFTMLV